jgi:hypothetical protein
MPFYSDPTSHTKCRKNSALKFQLVKQILADIYIYTFRLHVAVSYFCGT